MTEHVSERRLFCLTAQDENAFARVLREACPDIQMRDADTKKEVIDFRFRSGRAVIELPSLIDPERCYFQYIRASWMGPDPYSDWVFGDPGFIALVEFGANFDIEDAEAKLSAHKVFDLLNPIIWKSNVAGEELFFLGPKDGELAHYGLLTAVRSDSSSPITLTKHYDDSLWETPKKAHKKSSRSKSHA
jgi:hypothetical protein